MKCTCFHIETARQPLGLLFLTLTSAFLLLSAQSSRGQAPSVVQLVNSVLHQTGIPSTPLSSGQADGTQILPGVNQQPMSLHLELSSSGMTVDLESGAEKRTAVYSAFGGKVSSNIHASQTIPLRIALLSRFLHFPVLALATASQDSQYSVTGVDQRELNGKAVFVVNIASSLLNTDPTGQQPVALMTFYIDSVSFQVVQRDDIVYDAKGTAYNHSLAYSDYRTVGAATVPFHMVESMNGKLVAITQWTSVSLSF